MKTNNSTSLDRLYIVWVFYSFFKLWKMMRIVWHSPIILSLENPTPSQTICLLSLFGSRAVKESLFSIMEEFFWGCDIYQTKEIQSKQIDAEILMEKKDYKNDLLMEKIHYKNDEVQSEQIDSLPHLKEITRLSAEMRIQDCNSGSPLEQFTIHPFILKLSMKSGHYYFSFTNPSLSLLLTLGLVLLLLFLVTKKGGGKSVPNAWQSLVELLYDFVLNPVNEQIGGRNVNQKFFPCISVTFTFSLFCNPQGMIPYSFTVTSHFLITLTLSFSLVIGITIVGFQRHGLHFCSFSLPAGVPLPLAPFLVLLELIPHCFRALSSGIRLFANMMAGHSSVKILSGSAWTILFLNNVFYFIGDPGPFFIVLALTGPELGVAILQAHVSTISICIYLNDATNLHQ